MRIAICASMSFYQKVIKICEELKSIGHAPIPPAAALIMAQDKDFDTNHYLDKYYGEKISEGRLKAIKNHFQEINQSEAILVINEAKNGYSGYIGGNVLMEMGLALYLNKPIYLLNSIDPKLPLKDECLALNPIILNQDLAKISLTK